jgi:NAD(P)-dependent dehydrogenase (short-subunit alcohol dehydrogenase family)
MVVSNSGEPDMELAGKTALITGAARGIGLETARYFCLQGAAGVVLLDLSEEALAEAVTGLREFGSRIVSCVADIGDRAALDRAVTPSCAGFKSIDILVNNAGICDENDLEHVEVWHRVLNVNLNGAYYVTLAVLPFMPDGGRIVNVSSILGRAGKVRSTAYAASKHGMLGLTKSLAMDLAARRITVNAVLPAWVESPMLSDELRRQASLIGAETAQVRRNAKKAIPLRRFVTPTEVASMIGFLASDAAGAITAQSFVIDGGYTCGM